MFPIVESSIRQGDINLVVDIETVEVLTHDSALWKLGALMINLDEQLESLFSVDSGNGSVFPVLDLTINNGSTISNKVTRFLCVLRLSDRGIFYWEGGGK